MNIRHYYQISAAMALNASLVSLIPIIIFLLMSPIFSTKILLVVATTPFFIYSFISYQYYLLQKRRYGEIEEIEDEETSTDFIGHSEVLLEFLPAPSLRMVLFDSEGRMVGEIKDLHFKTFRWLIPYWLDRFFSKSYGVYDQHVGLIGMFNVKNKEIQFLSTDGQVLNSIELEQKTGNVEKWSGRQKVLTIRKESLYTDIKFIDENEKEVARLKKGWMPVEWEKYYKNANTPVFFMDQGLQIEDKMMLMGYLAKYYCYREH